MSSYCKGTVIVNIVFLGLHFWRAVKRLFVYGNFDFPDGLTKKKSQAISLAIRRSKDQIRWRLVFEARLQRSLASFSSMKPNLYLIKI
ncbi:hypothetical protein L873DRAFT_1809394 [Choiromyces venosus 120613-1]|uniref:Uncharacterized protein n=1 Tax=Choiromyces venosus 120613-1 TaxID=1336337 RepID=A0A3N4JKX1_9PEZI|nr:hypothetical protein L873DRAFT_1809394 [Choiromyces venosus 120613-1]